MFSSNDGFCRHTHSSNACFHIAQYNRTHPDGATIAKFDLVNNIDARSDKNAGAYRHFARNIHTGHDRRSRTDSYSMSDRAV